MYKNNQNNPYQNGNNNITNGQSQPNNIVYQGILFKKVGIHWN